MASGMIRLYTQQFVRFVPLVAQKHKLITIFLLHFSRKQRNFMFCEAFGRARFKDGRTNSAVSPSKMRFWREKI